MNSQKSCLVQKSWNGEKQEDVACCENIIVLIDLMMRWRSDAFNSKLENPVNPNAENENLLSDWTFLIFWLRLCDAASGANKKKQLETQQTNFVSCYRWRFYMTQTLGCRRWTVFLGSILFPLFFFLLRFRRVSSTLWRKWNSVLDERLVSETRARDRGFKRQFLYFFGSVFVKIKHRDFWQISAFFLLFLVIHEKYSGSLKSECVEVLRETFIKI